MAQETKTPPQIQKAKGILQVTNKSTKTGASYLHCRVGEVLTNAFAGNVNYGKVASLENKPVILEYTITSKGKDFIDVNLDPNPSIIVSPDISGKQSQEVMTKADWEAKDHKRWRVECLRIVANIKTLDPANPAEFIAMAREFEEYVYEDVIKAKPDKEELAKAYKETETTPLYEETQPSEAITVNQFYTTATDRKGLNYKTRDSILKELGITDIGQWDKSYEEALDVLAQAKGTSWRKVELEGKTPDKEARDGS